MIPEITKAEGITKGTKIYRINGSPEIQPASKPGHTQFRTQFDVAQGWFVAQHGVVCFCAVHVEPNWVGFEVITVPKVGMFVHVEPFYT